MPTSHDQPELLLEAKRFRVLRMHRQLEGGAVHDYDVVMHPGSVVVVPMLADNRVCLIRNYRIAIGETLLELPAGTLDRAEDPAATAARELEEETGYRAAKIEKLCEFFVSPGILNERMHLFLATELTPGPTAREAGEEIENEIVAWEDAMRLLDAGQIRDAKSLVGLLYYDRVRRGR
jgi:ADP-ribose pyrophosphatase